MADAKELVFRRADDQIGAPEQIQVGAALWRIAPVDDGPGQPLPRGDEFGRRLAHILPSHRQPKLDARRLQRIEQLEEQVGPLVVFPALVPKNQRRLAANRGTLAPRL